MPKYYLSLDLFFALAGIILVSLYRKDKLCEMRVWAAIFTGLQLWLTIEMLLSYDVYAGGVQFSERIRWFGASATYYLLGVDGINLPFLLMANLLLFVSVLLEWRREKEVKGFLLNLLIIDFSINGLLTALNLLLLAVFLGLLLFATFLFAGLWHDNRRPEQAARYGIFALCGYFLILLSLLLTYYESHIPTFDILELFNGANLTWRSQVVIAPIFLIGIAIFIPLIPMQNWLINIVQDSSLVLKIIVIGLIGKSGIYLLLRPFLGLFPAISNYLLFILAIWGLLNLLYAGLSSWGQKHYTTDIAYSAVSQSGLVLLGLASLSNSNPSSTSAALHGAAGAILLAISQGILFPVLFMWEKGFGHTEPVNSTTTPETSTMHSRTRPLLLLSLLAASGAPGFAIFCATLLCFLGLFALPGWQALTILGMLGVALNAGILGKYLLKSLRAEDSTPDFSYHWRVIAIFLLALLFIWGILPGIILRLPTVPLQNLINIIHPIK